MWPIEKRCQQRDTRAFVAPETVDLLGEKMIGIIADRRMTKMHRYLGEHVWQVPPRLFPGLRVWHGGFGGPTTLRSRQSVGINLASNQHPFERLGFSIGRDNDTEAQVAERYHHPERQWLGQRRDITSVDLHGWPGSPGRDDQIHIEYWNQNGVGQEIVVVFDDLNPVQEIAWDVKGDKARQVYLDDEFCTLHGRHFEDHEHVYQPGRCALRSATLAESLTALAGLAARHETAPDAEGGDA